jgi:Protein of unknown function (DUF1580)
MLTHDAGLINLNDVRELLPNRPNVATVFRWCLRGIRGVRLEHVRVGRRIMTTADALDRFLADVTAAHDAPPAERAARRSSVRRRPGRRSEARRQRDLDVANRELQGVGI